ncbi:MAG: class I SAM-dependent methyltransferase [Deltaproteobacteria bacterium]|nr:class I SAM-dependent methyltransferase [Deltaproteobacteria bacterium]
MSSDRPPSRLAFMIITLIHDNPLRHRFENPIKTLKAAGLKPGLKVLEVGCGPGFFTIPAAEIVGDEGLVYAVDVHPLAIEKVQKKIESKRLTNVCPMRTNASDTGLPDQSIDLVFIFGLPRIVGGQESMIPEIHRILKPGGMLSYKKTRGSEKELIRKLESAGFIYSGKQKRIFFFKKEVTL